MRARGIWFVAAGLALALVMLAGCEEIGGSITLPTRTTAGGGETTTTEVDTTTTAAETTTTEAETTTTQAETTTTEAETTTTAAGTTDTTEAPPSDDEGSNNWLYALIAFVLIAIVVVALLLSRRGKKGPPAAAVAAAVPAWKSTADQAYSQARWLYENLTPEIAQWRGDLLHTGVDPSAPATSDVASAHQQTWDQLGIQMTAAATTLYSLEPQVDPVSQPVVRSVIDDLNNTRTAVDEVASARLEVHRATDAFGADAGNQALQQALATAHEHENQMVQNLNSNRTVLYGALANLAALK